MIILVATAFWLFTAVILARLIRIDRSSVVSRRELTEALTEAFTEAFPWGSLLGDAAVGAAVAAAVEASWDAHDMPSVR